MDSSRWNGPGTGEAVWAPDPDTRPTPAGSDREPVRLVLLGGFDLVVDDRPVTLPSGSERLLAFIALCCRAAVPRALISGTLWPETSERYASANLRSALYRLQHACGGALDVGPTAVRLAPGVSVDFYRARALAHRVLRHQDAKAEADSVTVERLTADLLPGWYEEWAVLQAEDWRQLRLHALERLAQEFTAAGRGPEAVVAAHAAIRADPLRESAQVCLVQAHLAEGNAAQALRDYERYARRLRAELGMSPSARLRHLVAAAGTALR